MRNLRSLAVFAAFTVPFVAATAQEAGEPDAAARPAVETPLGTAEIVHAGDPPEQARRTLWVAYPERGGDHLDHAQYLGELQLRCREQGIAIGVLMPMDDAERVAAGAPRFRVAGAAATSTAAERLGQIGASSAYVCRGASAEVELASRTLDGVVDALAWPEQADATISLEQAEQQLTFLVANVADGGDFAMSVERCLRLWPRAGRAHAAAVLHQWWNRGDLAAARRAVQTGIDALAGESLPMSVFADLVLRGDRNDPEVQRLLAVAMAPAAATAPDGVHTQLTYLRALLRAGQDRLAGRIAATLPKHLAGLGQEQLLLAETLMEAATPAAHRDQAERAIAAAREHGADERWVYATRHKVLTRCGDAEAADRLMAEYRTSAVGRGDLNNDAWYLMVRPETMGRFDTLALAQVEEMLRREGDGISSNSEDTAALAYFLDGQLEKAVELQTDAVEDNQGNAVFAGRLQRYEAALRARRARAAGQPTEPGRRRQGR